MQNLMHKINIFWIEDNPVQSNTFEVDGVKFPSFAITLGDKALFSFRLFQHPVEVYEYLLLVNELNERGLAARMGGECWAALPDVVVFDYKLSDNFSTTNLRGGILYLDEASHKFLQEHSVSMELKKSFADEFAGRKLFIEREDVQEGNYNSDEFKDAINAKSVSNLDDEFGLYAGIAIIREFKDYITIGVPATLNKTDKSVISANSLFYEWLNTYDIKDAIERPDRGGKKWDDILQFALPLLRRRIEKQVKTGKVTPSYDQLVALSRGGSEEGVFSFHSAYGERHLPVAGLFIDKSETAAEWAVKLLEQLPENNPDIHRAVGVSDELWGVFCEDFGKRIDLSDYTFRKDNLTADEQAKFDQLKKEFCGEAGVTIEVQRSIQESFISKRSNQATVRLAVLHLVTRAAIEMNKLKKVAPHRELYGELTPDENFNLLFPKVTFGDHLLLPMHAGARKDGMIEARRVWLKRNILTDQDTKAKTQWHEFESWITAGEKRLLKSIFFSDEEHHPVWLL